MFIRIVIKSLWVRKERLFISIISVMLAAAMVTSLLTINLDIRERMGKELRSYGANIVVLPGEKSLSQFKAKNSSIIGYVPFLYFKEKVGSKNIEFAGTDLKEAKNVNPWWHIEGSLPIRQEEALLGINVANKLGLKNTDVFKIGDESLNVTGILDTGTSDDDKIFIPMKNAEAISGKSEATLVQMSVLGDIDSIVKYIDKEGYKAKKIMQVAESEKSLLDKTQLLMGLVAVFVLSAVSLGLFSTMVTSILERRREIGLMKALGAGNGKLVTIFLAETGMVGLAGGILGYFAGLLLSQVIGTEIFDVKISIKPEIFILTILISIFIILIASLVPIKKVIAIDPIITLRGE